MEFFDIAWADPDSENSTLAYLVKLLGGWVANIYGVEGFESAPTITALMVALGYANNLAIVFGGVIAVYIYGASTFNASMVGEAMNKGWSPVWMPVRVGLAAFLIIPTPSNGGYGSVSFAQELVVRLAIQGSMIGDEVWVESSNALFKEIPFNPTSMQYFPMPNEMYKLQSCAVGTQHGERGGTDFGTPGDPDKFQNRYQLVKARPCMKKVGLGGNHTAEKTCTTVTNENFIDRDMTLEDLNNVSEIRFGESEFCGSIDLSASIDYKLNQEILEALDNNKFSDAVRKNAMLSGKQALVSLFNDTKRFAEKTNALSDSDGWELINIIQENPDGTEAYDTEIEPLLYEFLDIVINYNIAVGQSVANSYEGTFGQKIEEGFRKQMEKGGWMYAGAYFWEMTKITEGINKAASLYSMGEIADYNKPTAKLCEQGVWEWFSGLFGADGDLDCKRARMTISQPETLLKNASEIATKTDQEKYSFLKREASLTACDASNCPMDEGLVQGLASDWVLGMFVAEDADGLEPHEKGYLDGANPYAFITGLGANINTTSELIYLTKNALNVTSHTLDHVADSAGWAGTGIAPIVAVLEGLAQMAMIIALSFAGLGFILSFVFPLIPVMHWVMIVVSWFTTVVEAVAAIPLWVVMSALPEGEGIVGLHGQRGIALVAAILLRPALSVMGLMTAIYMGYLGFGFYNELFWQHIRLEDWSAATGLMSFIAVPLIYVTGVMAVMKFVFSIIPKFSQAILEWLTSFGSSVFGTYHEEDFNSANSAWSGVASSFEQVRFQVRNPGSQDKKG